MLDCYRMDDAEIVAPRCSTPRRRRPRTSPTCCAAEGVRAGVLEPERHPPVPGRRAARSASRRARASSSATAPTRTARTAATSRTRCKSALKRRSRPAARVCVIAHLRPRRHATSTPRTRTRSSGSRSTPPSSGRDARAASTTTASSRAIRRPGPRRRPAAARAARRRRAAFDPRRRRQPRPAGSTSTRRPPWQLAARAEARRARPRRLPRLRSLPRARPVPEGLEGDIVVLYQTGCAMVVSTGYPYTSHRVTYVHNLFQNGAATLRGLVEMFHERHAPRRAAGRRGHHLRDGHRRRRHGHRHRRRDRRRDPQPPA